MRYFLEISYRGSQYHGWQKQQNAIGVQAVVEEALQTLTQQPISINGSGRTDTGVHALQQWAHLGLDPLTDIDRFQHRLNLILPHDIAIRSIVPVREGAHARFDAVRRSYEYHMHQQKAPFLNGLSYFFSPALNLEKMNSCCKIIADAMPRNYACFTKSGGGQDNHLCTVYHANWERTSGRRLIFRITANRFLRNMVRAMVGTCLDIGSGRLGIDDFKEILNSQDRERAGRSVPAEGLYLSRVEYPPELFLGKA